MNQFLIQFRAEEQAAFFCECPTPDCVRRVALSQREYDGVRRTGGFLVSPDCRRWSGVLLRTSRYVVVKDFRVALERVPGGRPEPSRWEEPADPGPPPAALPAAPVWWPRATAWRPEGTAS
jgi:hypothetical protein